MRSLVVLLALAACAPDATKKRAPGGAVEDVEGGDDTASDDTLPAPRDQEATPVPWSLSGDTVNTSLYTGQIRLPDAVGVPPSSLRVVTGLGGTAAPTASGTFETRMNDTSTGLIRLETETGRAVALAVYPKHQDIISVNPEISVGTTARALAFTRYATGISEPRVAQVFLLALDVHAADEIAALEGALEDAMVDDVDALEDMPQPVLEALSQVGRALSDAAPNVALLDAELEDTCARWFCEREEADGVDRDDGVQVTATLSDPTNPDTMTVSLIHERSRAVVAVLTDPEGNELDRVFLPPAGFAFPGLGELLSISLHMMVEAETDRLLQKFGIERSEDYWLELDDVIIDQIGAVSTSSVNVDLVAEPRQTLTLYGATLNVAETPSDWDNVAFFWTYTTEFVMPLVGLLADVGTWLSPPTPTGLEALLLVADAAEECAASIGLALDRPAGEQVPALVGATQGCAATLLSDGLILSAVGDVLEIDFKDIFTKAQEEKVKVVLWAFKVADAIDLVAQWWTTRRDLEDWDAVVHYDIDTAFLSCHTDGTACVGADLDGDGWTVLDGDCDDDDASIHPAREESAGDGVDNDCNGATDERFSVEPLAHVHDIQPTDAPTLAEDDTGTMHGLFVDPASPTGQRPSQVVLVTDLEGSGDIVSLPTTTTGPCTLLADDALTVTCAVDETGPGLVSWTYDLERESWTAEATIDDGSWSVEVEALAAARSPAGELWLAACTADDELLFVHPTSGAWTGDATGQTCSRGASIAVDATGAPWLGWGDGRYGHVAEGISGAVWTWDATQLGYAASVDVAPDPSTGSVAALLLSSRDVGTLYRADAGTWQTTALGEDLVAPLGVAPDGTACALSNDDTVSVTLRCDDASGVTETLVHVVGRTGSGADLAPRADGTWYFAYQDQCDRITEGVLYDPVARSVSPSVLGDEHRPTGVAISADSTGVVEVWGASAASQYCDDREWLYWAEHQGNAQLADSSASFTLTPDGLAADGGTGFWLAYGENTALRAVPLTWSGTELNWGAAESPGSLSLACGEYTTVAATVQVDGSPAIAATGLRGHCAWGGSSRRAGLYAKDSSWSELIEEEPAVNSSDEVSTGIAADASGVVAAWRTATGEATLRSYASETLTVDDTWDASHVYDIEIHPSTGEPLVLYADDTGELSIAATPASSSAVGSLGLWVESADLEFAADGTIHLAVADTDTWELLYLTGSAFDALTTEVVGVYSVDSVALAVTGGEVSMLARDGDGVWRVSETQ